MSQDKSRSQKVINEESSLEKAKQAVEETPSEDAIQILETAKKIDPKVFDGISHSKRETLIRTLAASITIRKIHSGPIPDPETLEGYNNVIPDGAERIMRMAEKEQDSRIADRSMFTRRMMNQSGMGQIMGFIICMTAISGGIYLSSIGKETTGIATILGALAALVGAFVYTKYKEK